jgi:hypothetical protein
VKIKNLNIDENKNVIFKKTKYLDVYIESKLPFKNVKSKRANIGCVLNDYIFDSLDYEANLYSLTPRNYKYIIKHIDLDFILVNSLMEDSTGTWKAQQWNKEIIDLVRYSRENQVKTVFWLTKGERYIDFYVDILSCFDFVYCANSESKNILNKKNIQAKLLEPCVQPLIFNPLKTEVSTKENFKVIFDGWADIDRFEKSYNKSINDEILKNLNIIESRCLITKNRVDNLSRYSNYVLGNVHLAQKAKLLKHSTMLIMGEESINDKTDSKWLALQGMACRLPVFILSKSYNDEPLFRSAIGGESKELERYLKAFTNDDLLRQRYGHLALREVLESHTFNHRLNEILTDVGAKLKIKDRPKISLITPTRRLSNINGIVNNFKRQSWPKKELILVANVDTVPKDFKLSKLVSKFATVPQNCFAGEALNKGVSLADGAYIFRIDDDDLYGENYCTDMVLAAEAWEIDFLGKVRTLFYSFEGETKVYCLNPNNDNIYLAALPYRDTRDRNAIGVTGNSFAGKREFFVENQFVNSNYSAADIFFQDSKNFYLKRIAKMDFFNVLVERRSDQSTHTWKTDTEVLKQKARKAGGEFYTPSVAFL